MNDPNLSSFIWSVADLLRGDYKQSEYGKVILAFTVLSRLDCVLEKSKAAVLIEVAAREKANLNPERFLLRKSGQHFFNTSPLDMKRLMGDPDHIRENLFAYVQAFSPADGNTFERFEFHIQIDRLAKNKLLYLVLEIIQRVNDLFDGDLTDQDKLVYVNNVIMRKLMESETLKQQATNNTKEQFANSLDLKSELMNATIAALEAHTAMSTSALSSESVRSGIKDVPLGPARLYESLRGQAVDEAISTG